MTVTGWNRETSPYHPGERELHTRLGREDRQNRMGRQIHLPYMTQQHRDFFSQLPFLIAGTVDQEGRPWASILFGQPGFMSSPDERSLLIQSMPVEGDPARENLRTGSPIGFVGIELETRRRNRLNGVINEVGEHAFKVDVVQSYGNCPQYIQTRDTELKGDPAKAPRPEIEQFTTLNEAAINVIRNADTFFVASYNNRDDKYDNGGADVNHRGGRPGFVKVEGNTLTIPDYIGNFAFNTFGNFVVYPRAGLLFIDFETADLWQLTGTVELDWDKTDEIRAFRGAERAWRFHLDHGVRLLKAAPMRWEFGELSPRSALTGNWDEAEATYLKTFPKLP